MQSHSKQYDNKPCFVAYLPFSCPPLDIFSFCNTGSYFESAYLQGNTQPLYKCSKDFSWCFAWRTTCILRRYLHRSVCLWNGRRTRRKFPCPGLPLPLALFCPLHDRDEWFWRCEQWPRGSIKLAQNLYVYYICTCVASQFKPHVKSHEWLISRAND